MRLPALLFLLALAPPAAAQQQAACPYAAWKSGFKDDARAQATCLLRPVKLYARLGASAPLPGFLDSHVAGARTSPRPRCALAGAADRPTPIDS